MSEPICDVCGSEVGVKISDSRAIAEMIAIFRTPPSCSWIDLANDIETVLKSERERCAKIAEQKMIEWKDFRGGKELEASFKINAARQIAAAIRAVPPQQQEMECAHSTKEIYK